MTIGTLIITDKFDEYGQPIFELVNIHEETSRELNFVKKRAQKLEQFKKFLDQMANSFHNMPHEERIKKFF